MTALEDELEALGHPLGALPEPRLLADLFVRFQTQVPLRPAPASLGPHEVASAWLEGGAGCCRGTRVRTFEALATAAGFALEPGTARAGDGTARRVLLAEGGRVLIDASFPLPAPLLLDPPADAASTGYGTLSTRPASAGGTDVILETRGDERLLFRVIPGEPQSGEASADGDAGESLFRLHEDRLLRWRDGVLEIADSWSRFRFGFPASDADGLEGLFGPPIAGSITGGTVVETAAEPTLAVYHAVAVGLPRLLQLLSDPGLHASILPEGWVTEKVSACEDGFERSVVAEGKLLRSERFTLLPAGLAVAAAGPLAFFRTRTWRLEARAGGTRLRLLATFRDPVPPRGLSEGTRRRLVFELASELLALDRPAAEG